MYKTFCSLVSERYCLTFKQCITSTTLNNQSFKWDKNKEIKNKTLIQLYILPNYKLTMQFVLLVSINISSIK